MYIMSYIMYITFLLINIRIMKVLNSTEARQNFSLTMDMARKEPITILKKERDIAVILSSERYHELKRIEDILYGKAAELAIREGLISDQDANELLDNI